VARNQNQTAIAAQIAHMHTQTLKYTIIQDTIAPLFPLSDVCTSISTGIDP
jgi:hypothetical protein